MKRRTLVMILALISAVLIATTSTLAYLTDTDADVNVMTLGNVEIEQIEKERIEQSDDNQAETNLKDFQNDKPLFPYVGEMGEATGEQQWPTGGSNTLIDDAVQNVVDKFVFVENTGNSDAYVRTWFAFEQGDLTAEQLEELIGLNLNEDEWSYEIVANNVEIDGGKYQIVVADYLGNTGDDGTVHPDGLLPKGETTRPSLLQVYLSKEADNKDVEMLDSNSNGLYDILVVSQAVQSAGFENAAVALNEGFLNGVEPADFDEYQEEAVAWFEQAYSDFEEERDHVCWTGESDTSWYNETATEFVITTAEQLSGLAELVDGGNTFEGKTIKLGKDICLEHLDENGEPVCFEPIGSYRKETPFKGTFDGQGHTIDNMSQNTWALDTGYYYGDLGLGLFGLVEDATIQNLTMNNASISGESGMCGTIAAAAYGDCTFENITISNSEVADYQYYSGGLVGWASGNHVYKNCDVDASTTIATQWGDFDNSTGGIIGGCGGSASILFEDCDVACRIDAYNDVTSTYQWYAYRRCGMLIGNPGKTKTVDGTTYADAPQLTAQNCTVTYGDWANYTYCEFAGTSWPYVRVQEGISNSAYSNPRYGHPTDANGNQVVDDSHVHNDGEDHFIECTFDQLYGGGQGVYGWPTHDGVTIVYNNK